MRFLSLLALAAPLVSAIEFTSPAENATLSKGQSYDLTWSTVDTDSPIFSIYLVNFVNWPPFYTPLAYDVETSAGQYSVRVPCDVDTSYGFQFNAINGTNVYVIYAQTPKFFVSGGPCKDPTSASPSCTAATTVTVTVSSTLSGSGASTITPEVHTAAPSPGKCPDTIGWGESGYHYPVTLTAPPRGGAHGGAHDYGNAPRPTGAPAGGAGAWLGKGKEHSTSTVYSTVYKDMSEVRPGSCHKCRA